MKKFDCLLQKEILLVEFYADWCEPCKLLDGILEEVQMKMGEKIFIQKIDVDVSQEISEFYHVMSVPVLILFKNGKQVWRMNGFLMANELIKTIEKNFKP
ncbi:MAG: thioredoxin domain-containing protein [Bacteroidia bacterium]